MTFSFSSASLPFYILNLLDTVIQARAITSALTRYQSDPLKAPPWFDIVHARNALQHRYLSLPALECPTNREDAIYDAVRLSLLIYSDMVLFPCPDAAGVKSTLANELTRSLNSCTLHNCSEASSRVLLWVSTLGAIAATNTPYRAWYVTKCKMCLQLLEIEDCTRYLRLMKCFLWWDYVCEGPAITLWQETRNFENVVLRCEELPVGDASPVYIPLLEDSPTPP